MELMNVQEVSNLLRLSTDSVYRMAKNGLLPFVKVGGVYRMEREMLEQWFKKQSVSENI